jgi:hypothetical protein
LLYDAGSVKRFLRELEQCLKTLNPAQREEVTIAYRSLIRGIAASTEIIGGHFRPTSMATLGLLGALTTNMGAGGGEKLLRDLRTQAPTIGPHVTALVSAL